MSAFPSASTDTINTAQSIAAALPKQNVEAKAVITAKAAVAFARTQRMLGINPNAPNVRLTGTEYTDILSRLNNVSSAVGVIQSIAVSSGWS